MEYLDFLKRKQIVDFPSGIDKEAEINLILFPFQEILLGGRWRRGGRLCSRVAG